MQNVQVKVSQNSLNNHQQYFNQIAKQLGIVNREEWYNIPVSRLHGFKGTQEVLSSYNSLQDALISVYPEEWQPWKFASVPHHFWDKVTNQQQFMEWIACKLHIRAPEDWYGVSTMDVQKLGGSAMINVKYGACCCKALQSLYPEYSWQPWRFKKVPKGFWDHKENRRAFFDWLFTKLFCTKIEDVYMVTKQQIVEHGGIVMLERYYKGSLARAMDELYPERQWQPWRFVQRESQLHLANDVGQHKQYFDWIASCLQLHTPNDWYDVPLEYLYSSGCKPLLEEYYDGSLWKGLQAVYPELQFKPWRFCWFKNKFWDQIEHQKDIMRWIELQLGITSIEEWCNVSIKHLVSLGVFRILQSYDGSLVQLLRSHFPNVEWETGKWRMAPASKSQQLLLQQIKSLLPADLEAEVNVYPPLPKLKFSTKYPMHMDVWVPAHNLVMEFQGIQHYFDHNYIHSAGNGLHEQYERDTARRNAYQEAGVNFMLIPFWWDGQIPSLVSTLVNEE